MPNPQRKSRRKWLIALLLLGLAAGGTIYSYYRRREVPLAVQTEKATRRDLTELVVANGRIQPVLQVMINPEVSGEIIDLPVKEGQRVRRGDLLVKIKPDNYLAVRNSAKASYKSSVASQALAQANLRKAELEYKRAKDLSTNKFISDSQLLDAETEFEVRKASFDTTLHQVDQAAATLAKAEDDLSKTTIQAPMDGTVSRLKSQRGERVVGTALMAGTEIMTVADLDAMEARVDIGEVDVVLIKTGQVARLEADAFRDRKFAGIVTEIANSAKGTGQPGQGGNAAGPTPGQQDATKFEVKIRLQEKEMFRPGMSVTAEVETRYRTNVLTVPIQSVTTRIPKAPGGKGNASKKPASPATRTERGDEGKGDERKDAPKPVEVIFLFDGDHVKQVPVKRGISDDAHVEITSGVEEGAEVVSGSYKAINRELEDGKKVTRQEPGQPKATDKP